MECGSKGTIAARAEILPSLVPGLEMGQTAAKFKIDETPLSNLGPKSPSFRFPDKYNFGCGRSYELRCLFKGREGAKAENGMRTSVCPLVLVKREKMRQVKKKTTLQMFSLGHTLVRKGVKNQQFPPTRRSFAFSWLCCTAGES